MTLSLQRPSARFDPEQEARRNTALEQADRQNWKHTGDVDHPHGLTVRGAITGTNVHNQTTPGNIASGTYTPTLTNVANLAASTAYEAQYMRIGSVVTVSGRVDVDPTATATLTQLDISLPIASNFVSDIQCGGAAFCSGVAGQGAAMLANSTDNRARMQWDSGADAANRSMYFTFTYLVI